MFGPIKFSFLAAACLVLAAAESVCLAAPSPSVTAVLSDDQAVVGQMVRLEIRVTGARNAEVPNDIKADGLEIHQTGTEQHFEMNNFSVSQSMVYTYTILPLKTGTFRISPQSILVAGQSLRTPELTLHVVGSGNQQAAPNSGTSGPGNIDTSKIISAELIVPKSTAYVGEAIPVVVKLSSAVRTSIEGVEIGGQGFTTQKLLPPDQAQLQVVGGRQWQTFTFKTAIAPVRPGKLEIGPVKATATVVVPVTARPRSRSRSPFDIFDVDPLDLLNPSGAFGERREVSITSEPAKLEVKPLPANAPPNFSGAVGNFTMTVEANPKSVQVGDPITVKANITGRGNFDRLNPPVLEDKAGWHEYPPNAKFEKDDDVGISGTKSFEMVFSPNDNKKQIAPFVFSYFDPIKERYETLRSAAIPIRVEGAPLASANASPAPSAAARAAATPPTQASGPPDILYQMTDRPTNPQSFVPLYRRPVFWLAQIPGLLLLLGILVFKVQRSRWNDREARRVAALEAESAELMRQLRRTGASPRDYLSIAARAVQLRAALLRKVDPNVVDAEMAINTFALDDGSRARLRKLFDRSDELRYSGSSNGESASIDRNEIVTLVENLRP